MAKTVRTARQILKVEPALWTFVTVEGIEPTNNAAEQALRPAVLWRKMSFGYQSKAGSEFVARILTVVTSLKAQGRNPLESMALTLRESISQLSFEERAWLFHPWKRLGSAFDDSRLVSI